MNRNRRTNVIILETIRRPSFYFNIATNYPRAHTTFLEVLVSLMMPYEVRYLVQYSERKTYKMYQIPAPEIQQEFK